MQKKKDIRYNPSFYTSHTSQKDSNMLQKLLSFGSVTVRIKKWSSFFTELQFGQIFRGDGEGGMRVFPICTSIIFKIHTDHFYSFKVVGSVCLSFYNTGLHNEMQVLFHTLYSFQITLWGNWKILLPWHPVRSNITISDLGLLLS